MINTEPAAGTDLSPELCRTITAASDIDSLPGQREIEVERSAFAMPALHSNLSRVLLNDAVGYGQAQARTSRLPLTRSGLRSKERVVDSVDVLLCNARARIRNHHANAVAIHGCNAQRPAIAHCVFGIQEQVQEHLLQTPRVPVDQRDLRAALILYLDPRDLELMLQECQRVRDNLVHIDGRKFGAAGAGKIKQVVDNLGSPEVCRVIFSRSPAFCGSPCTCFDSICAYEEMTASGVFTSCATPAASNPMDES